MTAYLIAALLTVNAWGVDWTWTSDDVARIGGCWNGETALLVDAVRDDGPNTRFRAGLAVRPEFCHNGTGYPRAVSVYLIGIADHERDSDSALVPMAYRGDRWALTGPSLPWSTWSSCWRCIAVNRESYTCRLMLRAVGGETDLEWSIAGSVGGAASGTLHVDRQLPGDGIMVVNGKLPIAPRGGPYYTHSNGIRGVAVTHPLGAGADVKREERYLIAPSGATVHTQATWQTVAEVREDRAAWTRGAGTARPQWRVTVE